MWYNSTNVKERNDKMLFFRKAILLIHGFAGGPMDYDELGNELQMFLDFDVYTFVLPGHDKVIISKVTREEWIMAADLQMNKLIERGYRTIYVVGHSMGGVIACHLAKKYKQVKKLVLAAPAFRYFSWKNNKFDVLDSLKKATKLFKDYDANMIISRVFKVPLTTAVEFMKLVEEHHNDPESITCPTMIIQGKNDKIVPKESSLYVHDTLKSDVNILIQVNNVTHDVFHGDRKEEMYKLVVEFFRDKNKYPRKLEKEM